MATTRRIRHFTHDMGRTRTHRRTRDQGEGDDFIAQVKERIDRIEQAIVALVNRLEGDDEVDPDDDQWEDGIDNGRLLSTTEKTLDPGQVWGPGTRATNDHARRTERTIDPAKVYGPQGYLRRMEQQTGDTIRDINATNRKHYSRQ